MGDNFDSTYKLLFRKYYANLLFYATRIVGEEEAEDVVQDVFVEYAFNDTWLLQPSLFLSQKGAKFSATVSGNEAEVKFNAMYFELPIMAAARFNVANNTNIVVSAGPYLACGVGGKTRTKMSISGSKTDIKEKTFGSDAFDRFDAGLGVGVAAEFGRIIVGIDGQFGLVKLADLNLDSNPKNINCAITLGYKF